MCEGQGEELDGVVEESMEVGQRGEVDREVWADGVCLVWEGSEFKGEGLYRTLLVYPSLAPSSLEE